MTAVCLHLSAMWLVTGRKAVLPTLMYKCRPGGSCCSPTHPSLLQSVLSSGSLHGAALHFYIAGTGRYMARVPMTLDECSQRSQEILRASGRCSSPTSLPAMTPACPGVCLAVAMTVSPLQPLSHAASQAGAASFPAGLGLPAAGGGNSEALASRKCT